MIYRIVVTIAVVLVCLFAATRHNDQAPAPTVTNDEPNTKGLQIN